MLESSLLLLNHSTFQQFCEIYVSEKKKKNLTMFQDCSLLNKIFSFFKPIKMQHGVTLQTKEKVTMSARDCSDLIQ